MRTAIPAIVLILTLGVVSAFAHTATFTTVADGDWTNPATWDASGVPGTASTIPSNHTINIRHTVNYNTGNPLKNNGTIRIQPVLGTTATLNFPTNINVENLSTGKFFVINGAFLQCRFVNCDDGQPYFGNNPQGLKNSGTWKNIGGMVELRNANVEVAQDWVNESGGSRLMIDSCVTTGQNFSISGSSSTETIRRSTITIGWHGSGNWTFSDGTLTLEAVQIQVAGASGSVQFNSGTANGDIDYIYIRNDVGGFSGGGGISASSSLTTSGIDLEQYCATFFTQNGKFTGNRTVNCTGPFLRNCDPSSTIIIAQNASPPSNHIFDFTTTNLFAFSDIGNLIPAAFSLTDNSSSSDPEVSFTVTTFNLKTVTQGPEPPYDLVNVGGGATQGNAGKTDPNCLVTGSGTTPTPTWTPGNSFININIQPGNTVKCTFYNDFVTAAAVSLVGQVFDTRGRALRWANVQLTGFDGTSRMATTNQFGYFRFDEVPVGQSYVMNAYHKQFSYSPQVISVDEDMGRITFYPNHK